MTSESAFALRSWRVAASIFFPLYLTATWKLMGLRPEHFAISALFAGLVFLGGERTARFAVLALPFLGVGILYDNMRLMLGLRGTIHVADVYATELRLFSVSTAAGPKILPEFFREHPLIVLDLLCGFAYMTYLAEYFLFAVYVFFKKNELFSRLALAFFVVNVLGIVTYLSFPVAPPWYVEQHGLGPAVLDALPSAAGAARFDELLGISYFKAFYARNANVFGAMPSLHVAYPTIVFFGARRFGAKAWVPALAFAVLVAFSAVYLRHHYVLDVLVGAVYGASAYGLVSVFDGWRERQRRLPSSQAVTNG